MNRKSLKQRMNIDDSIIHNRSMLTEIRHYFKLILLGNISVGKSAICKQLIESKFDDKYQCTINADYRVKTLLIDDNTWVEMNIWDTCGHEKYKTVTRQYYKDAQG
jgi:small GTP-binding protein